MNTALEPKAQQLAEQLLNAQVAFIKSRLSSAEAEHYTTRLIDFILLQGQFIQLEQIVSVESIKQVVQVYAFDLNLGGGMLELIGAMGQRLYEVANSHNASLQTLMPDHQMQQWIDKILELDQVREHLNQAIQTSPAAHDLIVQLTSSLVKKQLPDWGQQVAHYCNTGILAKTPLAKKIAKLWLEQEEKIFNLAEHQISQFVQQQSQELLRLDSNELKDIAWQIWQSIKTIPLNQLSTGIESLDIEEFFVLSYELWRHLRQTDYMQHLILTGVEVFFEIYGEYPVAELLEEIGITRQHLINDAHRFLPQVVEVLNQHNFLDSLIRLQLQDFYHSESTIQLIKNNVQQWLD